MRRLVLIFSVLALSLLASAEDRTAPRYSVRIDIRDAYISGILIMKESSSVVSSSIVNEFGVSAMGYLYDEEKGKVRILSVVKMLDRPMVKRTLRKDLQTIMADMWGNSEGPQGTYEYENSKLKIRYTFTPLSNEITQ